LRFPMAVDRHKETLAKLRDEIALEVKSAHLLVTEADKRKAVAEAAVANAEENLRIQEERYREGMAISVGSSPRDEVVEEDAGRESGPPPISS
jgi:outer membrane protein TolC